MEEFANVVDLFENTLSRKLSKDELEKHPLNLNDVRTLANESRQAYYKRSVPEKAEFEIRPFIDPTFNMGIMDYAVGGNISGNFENYVFNKNISGVMNKNIKQLLLYSHSIVINDPLDYLLDFFVYDDTPNPPDFIIGRIDAVNSLLGEYAEISGLIKNRIVIPVEFYASNLNDAIFLDQQASETIKENLKGSFSQKNVDGYSSVICNLIGRYNSFEGKADFFFPEKNYIPVLEEILRSIQFKFTSKDIDPPLEMAFLATLDTLNPASLTTQDMVRIREEEEIFAEWRSFLSAVLRKSSENHGKYLDPNDEFRETLEKELKNKGDTTIFQTKKSRWGNVFDGSLQSFSLGALAGALPELMFGDMNGLAKGITGGVTGVSIQTMLKFLKFLRTKNTRNALQAHFVAIGMASPKN